MRAWVKVVAVAVPVVVVIAAALFFMKDKFGFGKADVALSVEPVELHVMAVLNSMSFERFEAGFEREFGAELREAYPNLTIRFSEALVPDWSAADVKEQILRELENRRADLLYMEIDPTDEVLDWLAAQGALFNLDLFPGDKTWNMSPGTLRKLDGGTDERHELAMSMTTFALIYNPALFDQYNIPYPKDGMTWPELFELAKRFPSGAGLELPVPDAWYLAERLALTEGLPYADPDRNLVLIGSPEWRDVIRVAAEVAREGYVRQDVMYGAFTTGQAAMALAPYPRLRGLLQESGGGVDWRSVTEPVSAAGSGTASAYTLSHQWAIAQGSRHPDAAWELLAWLFRDESAVKWKSVFPDIMLTNAKAMEWFEPAERIEAFYKLPPRTHGPRDVSLMTRGMLSELFREEMNRIVSEEIPLDEGVRRMENAGNQLLFSGGAAP